MICPKRIAVTLFHVFAQGSVLASALRTSAVCSLSFCFKQTAITHTTVILVGSPSAKTKLYSSARMRLWCYTLLGYLFWLVDCSPSPNAVVICSWTPLVMPFWNVQYFVVSCSCVPHFSFFVVNSWINYLVDFKKKRWVQYILPVIVLKLIAFGIRLGFYTWIHRWFDEVLCRIINPADCFY